MIEEIEGQAGRGGSRALLALPFRLVGTLIWGAFRAGWWSAKVPVRVTARTTRVLGVKAVLLFVAGLAIGVVFAPLSGRELRSRLRSRLTGGPITDTELADKVGFELAHAPRTWHLPQPEVAVLQGRVELTGEVPHERGRDELERVASAVAGVVGIENHLVIESDGGPARDVTLRSDLHNRLVPILEAARVDGGGFGWAVGADPEPEPTALAALALDDDGARRWLLDYQHDDGGFALPTGEVEGSATTALVALALPEGDALQRAIDYTVASRAVKASLEEGAGGREAWGWTPDTWAWVEPTARALLLFLRRAPTQREAIDEARRVLAEREIDGGGWNYGNATALGTDLDPYVQTTAAAVMALQGDTTGLLQRGRALLVEQAPTEVGGLSLAMSLVALRLQSDEPYDELVGLLGAQYDRTNYLGNIGSLAWAVVATGSDLGAFRVPT